MFRLKEILAQKGMTAKQLAEAMNVTPQYISEIVRESGSVSVKVLANIANILNVPVSSLFEDYISPNSENIICCPKCGAKFQMLD